MKKYLIASIFFAFGCSKSCVSKNNNSNNTITIAIGSAIENIDPRYATSVAAVRTAQLVFASLLVMGQDGVPKPFLAKNVEKITDLSYKIELRDNLYFHDNTPITSSDVAYTFLELSSPDVNSPHQSKFYYLKNIEIIDDKNLIFELNVAYAVFMTDLCGTGIVSKKSCLNRSKKCQHEYNGSGPFMVEKWDNAKEVIHLKPFEKWFEGAAKAKLDIRVVREENTRVLELIAKKTDLIEGDIPASRLAELKNNTFLDVKIIPSFSFTYLAFNLRGPIGKDLNSKENITRSALANKKVRQAIAHAIDINQIIEKIFLNTAQRVTGLIPNTHWAKDTSIKLIDFDPEKAQKLLDEAGFYRKKDNTRFDVTITTSQDRMRQNIALSYANFLSKVGINVSIKVKDFSAIFQDMKQGNFEMFSALWVPVTDPDLYYLVHHSSNIPSEKKEGGNRHAYKNPLVDKLIEQGRYTFDQEQRKVIYKNIENILIDELPYIPLWSEDRIIVMNKRIMGYDPLSTGSLINLRKAYISE